MRTILANLLMIIYVTMSVAAHGSPYLTPQQFEKTSSDLTKIVCTNSGQDTTTALNTSCKTQQDKMLECELMHCSFHYIFLDQSSSNRIRGLRQGHTRTAEDALTALPPKSAKKPPRRFS